MGVTDASRIFISGVNAIANQSTAPSHLFDELGEGILALSSSADEQVELAFSSLQHGDAYMEVADGMEFEALPLRLVAFHIRKPEKPWRCKHRCSAERVRGGIIGCKA